MSEEKKKYLVIWVAPNINDGSIVLDGEEELLEFINESCDEDEAFLIYEIVKEVFVDIESRKIQWKLTNNLGD